MSDDLNKDELINQLEKIQILWDNNPEDRGVLATPFLNTPGMRDLLTKKFELLPELVQLMLAMQSMENKYLEKIAIEEGFLDFDSRLYINRNTAIAIIAGSIHRGSTASETAYRKTIWVKNTSSNDERMK